MTTILACICMLLLGYLLAGWRSQSESILLQQGAVARYGVTKLLKPGFEEKMSAIEQHLHLIESEFQKLPAPSAELSDEERAAALKRRRLIAENLKASANTIGYMREVYGLSAVEQNAVEQLIAEKEAEAQGMKLKRKSGSSKSANGASTKKPENAAAPKTTKKPVDESSKPPAKETENPPKQPPESPAPAQAEK